MKTPTASKKKPAPKTPTPSVLDSPNWVSDSTVKDTTTAVTNMVSTLPALDSENTAPFV